MFQVMPSQRHGMSCLWLTQVYDWSGWKELDPLGPEKVTLTEKRYSHTSWKSPNGLLLIGGAGSPTTTELVKTNIEEVEEEEDYEEEDEKKKKKPRNVYGFSMEHKIQDACGIPVEDTFILTGRCHPHNLSLADVMTRRLPHPHHCDHVQHLRQLLGAASAEHRALEPRVWLLRQGGGSGTISRLNKRFQDYTILLPFRYWWWLAALEGSLSP